VRVIPLVAFGHRRDRRGPLSWDNLDVRVRRPRAMRGRACANRPIPWLGVSDAYLGTFGLVHRFSFALRPRCCKSRRPAVGRTRARPKKSVTGKAGPIAFVGRARFDSNENLNGRAIRRPGSAAAPPPTRSRCGFIGMDRRRRDPAINRHSSRVRLTPTVGDLTAT